MKISRMILVLALLSSTQIFGSEAIGYYSSGAIKNSVSIVDRATPIHKLFMQRGRFFGTDQVQDTISNAADWVKNQYPDAEILQVGDISNKNGGSLAEHGSHQNGLDVDIVYLTINKKLQSQTAPYWQEEFVKNGLVSANLDVARNLELFKYLIIDQGVERIFVDAAIKLVFCSYVQKNNLLSDSDTKETLRRLRVEKLHSTHFHMRLSCPKTDNACKSQVVVPEGTGC